MSEPRSIRRSASGQTYWWFQWGGWGLFGAAQAFAAISAVEVSWYRIVTETVALYAAAFALSHLLRDYVRRRHWSARKIPQLAGRIALAGFVLAIPMALASNFMAVGDMHDSESDLQQFPVAGWARPLMPFRLALQEANWALVFTGWLIGYFVLVRMRERRFEELRQSELARALQFAELRLLKSQLNPHFLFNALNTIRSLVAYDPTRARDAITRLADMLRYTLSSSQEELVTLAQELAIVTDYLALESLRFDERLRVNMDVPAAANGHRIPVMLLQTVVENAIKHGIAELPEGGELTVRAVIDGEILAITVSNPRPPSPSGSAQEGIGLKNAAERLKLLFGARGTLELDLHDPALALVRIRVPANA